MPILTQINPTGDTVTIELEERFTFDSHSQFRPAYQSQPASVRTFIVDFQHTRYLDSAAMGMLLQLLEHVGGDANRINLVNLPSSIRELLRLAEFESFLRMK